MTPSEERRQIALNMALQIELALIKENGSQRHDELELVAIADVFQSFITAGKQESTGSKT